MLEFGACPRCKSDISPERKKASLVICNHCGFVLSESEEQLNDHVENKTMITFGLIATFWIASFIQLSQWDKHSLSILPILAKQTAGMATMADLESKAEMCMDLKKYDCVEQAYLKTAQNDTSKLLRAAHFQMKRAKYNEAAQTYYKFFTSGGQDLEASYSYAKALAELGQVDEAVKYFDQVLAAKPDVLQITVVNNYVKLLVKYQRFEQAKVLIEKIRKDGGPTAGSFMEAEFQQIQQMTTASRD